MLSFKKLQKLLEHNNFIIIAILTIDNMCVYIEVLSSSADIFLLYIPSKYDISVSDVGSDGNKINCFELKSVNADDFGGDLNSLQNTYDELTIDDENDENIAEKLEDNYKKPISITNIDEDLKIFKSIYKQLNRLKFCTQSLKYKIGIKNKNLLCCLKRDDSIQCYIIDKNQGIPSNKLFVIVDLELLYEKNEVVVNDIKNVRDGVYKILGETHTKNTKTLLNLTIDKENISKISESFMGQKNTIESYLSELDILLVKTNKAQITNQGKIQEVNDSYNRNSHNNIHSDTEKSHAINKLMKESETIIKTKDSITNTIIQLKTKQEDMFLSMDKILFDIAVMIDAINKHIADMK